MATSMKAHILILCGVGVDRPLVIRDTGPWDKHPTVTNDAEAVVRHLLANDMLKLHQRLLYYDSEGELTELRVKDDKFAGYGPPCSGDREYAEGLDG